MKARIAVVMMLVVIATIAAIPRTICYQGKLTDVAGVGENDTLDIRLRVFDVETGGDSLWAITIADVPIVHGLFDVNIGPIDLPFDEQYWRRWQCPRAPGSADNLALCLSVSSGG